MLAASGRVTSDTELLDAWQTGDRAAGTELTERHYGAVLRFFELKAGRNAQDLTQQTFLAVVAGKHRFAGRSTFKSYLFGIARRTLLNFLRKKRRSEAAMDLLGQVIPATGVTPSGIVAMHDEQRALLIALGGLPEEQQTAMQLFYWEGMRGEEIADVLDIPVSTVRNRLSRARQRLRQRVLEIAPGPRVSKALLADLAGWTRSLVAVSAAPSTQ